MASTLLLIVLLYSYVLFHRRTRQETNTKSDAKISTSKASGKAKKVPAQKRSRAAGRLAELMNMSVDVFAEICSHLFPIDLFHLSWASKRLRSIPMSKSARHIWHSAREGQLPTLPPCTDDLSEPMYIALLFTNMCQVYGANRAQRFHFTMRTRHSTYCKKTHAVAFKSLLWEGTLKGLGDHEAINFLAVVPENSHAKKVYDWLDEQDSLKIQQEDEISEARWNRIREKLLALGWETEDFPSCYNTEWTNLTQKPQALTDEVWKNLYPKLLPMLQTYRISRLEDERIDCRE
ncbi:hypothetical protein FRC03_001289 [Tulasnella sp. 419]|nr:hypothetical protein FRC03_001289 [Tulasnella sp. 419]